MEPVLRVSSLAKSYGDTTVLRDVSFVLERAAITLLMGRSGSGKSTLFKLLAALDRPNSGSIVLDGVDVTKLGDDALSDLRLRKLGLVFQSFNLLPDLTALENVRLPLDLAATRRKDAYIRACELLDLVGLSHRREARPNVLSGGEQQRVAIARALVNGPAVLLADEPTGNLDRKNAEMVYGLFRKVNLALGTTILIITHDEAAAAAFPDQLTIDEGLLVRQPLEISGVGQGPPRSA